MHGTPCAKPEQFDPGIFEKIWKAQHAFGIGQATFHGYWEAPGGITAEPASDRILASYYDREGKIMLIIANLTDHDESVGVKFNNESPLPDRELSDVMSGDKVPLLHGSLQLAVPARAFRLLMDGADGTNGSSRSTAP